MDNSLLTQLTLNITKDFMWKPQFGGYKTIGNYYMGYIGWLWFEIWVKVR